MLRLALKHALPRSARLVSANVPPTISRRWLNTQTSVDLAWSAFPLEKKHKANLPKRLPNANGDDFETGEDSYFSFESKSHVFLGIADGVGGWQSEGIDPAAFSHGLMSASKSLASKGTVTAPRQLLELARSELQKNPSAYGGSSTACCVVLDKSSLNLSTLNLGDSGFFVFRDGKIVYESVPQVSGFNTPYQTGVMPGIKFDLPSKGDAMDIPLQPGDIVGVVTDGVLDNLYSVYIERLIKEVQDEPAQVIAARVATWAHDCSYDDFYFSPISMKEYKGGMQASLGGKPDDITIGILKVPARSL